MNSKAVKKLRQHYRRDLRAKLGLEVDLARQLIKPRPRWCPRFIWGFGARFYFNKGLFDEWFNKK